MLSTWQRGFTANSGTPMNSSAEMNPFPARSNWQNRPYNAIISRCESATTKSITQSSENLSKLLKTVQPIQNLTQRRAQQSRFSRLTQIVAMVLQILQVVLREEGRRVPHRRSPLQNPQSQTLIPSLNQPYTDMTTNPAPPHSLTINPNPHPNKSPNSRKPTRALQSKRTL
jgi:hypothetical protein